MEDFASSGPAAHWKRGTADEDIEGAVHNVENEIVVLDPKMEHGLEQGVNGGWMVTWYLSKGVSFMSESERELLRRFAFRDATNPEHVEPEHQPLPGRRPKRSTRKKLWNTAAALSVMFATLAQTLEQVALEAEFSGSQPTTAILEVGGYSATCDAVERCGPTLSVAEHMLMDDLYDAYIQTKEDEDMVDVGMGPVEIALVKANPGKFWVHMTDEWVDDGYLDIMAAVDRQLREGRAVVLQKDDGVETSIWEETTCGWEEAGYNVLYD